MRMQTDQARFDVQPLPAPALQRPSRSRDDGLLRSSSSAPAKLARPWRVPADLVETAQHQLPGLAVVGHVGVLVAVEPTGGELLVHHLGYRHPRLLVLGQRHVAEGAQRRLLLGSEERAASRDLGMRSSTTLRGRRVPVSAASKTS